MGEPYYPPKELNGEQMKEVQRELERRMLETYIKAKESLER
jgi:hypothetical protein